MMIKNFMLFIFIAVILSGCTSPVKPTPNPSIKTTPIAVKTTSVPNRTSTPAFPVVPEVTYTLQCFQEINKEVALQDITSGTIFQNNSLLEIQTGKKYSIPFSSSVSLDSYGSQVSPNRNMFAYIETIQADEEILSVVDANAQVLAKIPFQRNDLEQPRWLDNERLILYTSQTDIDGSVLVVNPFIMEQTPVSNLLPQFMNLPGVRGNSVITWSVEYSPDLRYVVYLDKDLAVVVYDTVAKKTLWHFPFSDLIGKPAWSPDGQQVVISGGASGQIYLLDLSKHTKKNLLNENLENQTWVPSWSPNGTRIAFLYFTHLMIYDRDTDKTLDTCISALAKTPFSLARWSPDGKQLLVKGYPSSGTNVGSKSPVLIDFEHQIIYTNIMGMENIRDDVWINSLP